jgi:hypothetical protein
LSDRAKELSGEVGGSWKQVARPLISGDFDDYESYTNFDF